MEMEAQMMDWTCTRITDVNEVQSIDDQENFFFKLLLNVLTRMSYQL